jgi:TatD DNase family protein
VNFVDTHCHLDFDQYAKDRAAVLDRAWKAGLDRILVPGIDVPTSQSALRISDSNSKVYAAVGTHPNSAASWDAWSLESLEMMAENPKVVAIGEIGLDYYRNRSPKEYQRKVFQDQLRLAYQLDIPVVIHVRNTHPEDRECIRDVIQILSAWETRLENSGVVHSYSGNLEEADQLLSMGYYLGITGPVTYKNAEVLRNVVRAVPLDCLLIETDGPFLSPQAKRGKRNEPAFVRFVAEKIAEVRDISLETVAEQTARNADRLFRWRD